MRYKDNFTLDVCVHRVQVIVVVVCLVSWHVSEVACLAATDDLSFFLVEDLNLNLRRTPFHLDWDLKEEERQIRTTNAQCLKIQIFIAFIC